MEYYLIDENKVRVYYENSLLSETYGKIDDVFRFIFYLKNVSYLFDIETLELRYVKPSADDAYVPTLKGFIKWKNSVKTIDRNGDQIIDSVANSRLEKGFIKIIFCSGFICLGETPSSPTKITKDKIVFAEFRNEGPKRSDINFVKSIKELNIQVIEDGNKLVFDFGKNSLNGQFHIGLQIKETAYIFYTVGTAIDKLVIPKGTCFKTRQIINDVKKSKSARVIDSTYELCYE
jgi:hypothetical protein